MTKNNRFKKVVRTYQHVFNVPYMTALNAVSQPFVITPEMVALADQIREMGKTGLVLISGKTGSGKTYLQHYLSTSLGQARVIEQDKNGEVELIAPSLISTKNNLFKETNQLPVENEKNSYLLFNDETFEKHNVGAKSALLKYLRMRPDVLSLPEIRSNESFSYFHDLAMIPMSGHLVLANIHSSGVYDSLNRLINIFVNKKVIKEPFAEEAERFIKDGLSLIVDVDRVCVDGKSLIVLSTYVVDEEGIKFWRQGTLGFYLKSQGFVSAAEKKEQFLKLL